MVFKRLIRRNVFMKCIMPRLTAIGMAITVFTLTGCVDNRDIQSLRSAYISLSNEVAYLQARVTAVEEACLQINARLINAENRKTASDQSLISRPVTISRSKAKHLLFLPDSNLSDQLTRSSFSRRLAGMTVSEVLTILGKPDKVNEDAGIRRWNYNAVRLTTEGGGVEESPALIVFEQGCVTRVVLTENAQYSSEPEEGESESTAVQTNQQP